MKPIKSKKKNNSFEEDEISLSNESNNKEMMKTLTMRDKDSLHPYLQDRINQQITIETKKQLESIRKSLDKEDFEIMKAITKGMSEKDIKEAYNVDHQYIENLYLNPVFLEELSKLQMENTFISKDFRNKELSKLSARLMYDLLENNEISYIPAQEKMRLLLKISEQFDKQEEEKKINLDVTVQLKQMGIDENRIKLDNNGVPIIKSKFKTFQDVTIDNDTGKILK